jgi:hypothetical protein
LQLGFSPEVRAYSARSGWELGVISAVLNIVAKTKQKSRLSIPNNKVIIMPEMVNADICRHTGKSLKHNELIKKLRYRIKWMRSTANEINRLYNTSTIRFIQRSNMPKGRKVIYGSFVVNIKEHKEEKECTKLTLGGDQIEYPGDKSTRTTGFTTAKIIINSVIFTLGAKFLVIDITHFYFNTPLGRFEYMVINLASLPQETIAKYDLFNLAQDGKVYIEIQKGGYGYRRQASLMSFIWEDRRYTVINMSLLKLWFIRNPVLVSYSI